MGRVVHTRLYGLHPSSREWLHARFHQLAAARDWRDQRPWLADSHSAGLFEQLYFQDAVRREALDESGSGRRRLSAAGFMRVAGDETDALALVFMMRDLSERFATDAVIRDPDNPIAKLRRIELSRGRLRDGAALESILVRRPIFKRMRGGGRIEMYP